MVLVIIIVLFIIFAGDAPAERTYRGVQLHSLWSDRSLQDIGRELDLAQSVGSNAVRLDVAWGSLELEGRGVISVGYEKRLDYFVEGAATRGMTVLATLYKTPCWASRAPEALKQGCTGAWWDRGVADYPPNNPRDYANAARWLTARYGRKLAAIEIWNEPNLRERTFWNTPDLAGDYADLVRAAYPAAKAGDPNVPVLIGSFAGTDPGFLKALYAKGIKGHYDALAVHSYDDRGFAALRGIHKLQLAHGDHAHIWVTEFGWPTGHDPRWHVSEATQWTNIRRAYRDLRDIPYVRAAMLYDLRDEGTNPLVMEDHFGLVRRDFTPKPSYRALQRALRGV